jgi:hypothetical protein
LETNAPRQQQMKSADTYYAVKRRLALLVIFLCKCIYAPVETLKLDPGSSLIETSINRDHAQPAPETSSELTFMRAFEFET